MLEYLKPAVSDQDTERLVNDRVDTFWKAIEGGANKRGQVKSCNSHPTNTAHPILQIVVKMSEKKVKKNWFSTGEEEVPWEQWCVLGENMYGLLSC